MGDAHGPSAEELREYARSVRPQYAGTPADALQCQLDALTEAVRLTHAARHLVGPDWMNTRNSVDDVRQFTIAPLYFWTARIADVVEQASRSYPLQPETFLPTLPHAFCVFERPVLWAVIDGVRSGLSTLTWATGVDEATGVLRLRIRGLVWTPPHCSVCLSIEITNPVRISNPDGDPTLEDEGRAIYRWICSAAMFVEQRIADSAAVRVGSTSPNAPLHSTWRRRVMWSRCVVLIVSDVAMRSTTMPRSTGSVSGWCAGIGGSSSTHARIAMYPGGLRRTSKAHSTSR
jgi:hypothetical protein